MGKTAKSVPFQSDSGLSEHDIVERVVAAVMEQRLRPGIKLSEAKLCESFGVGRMRIRRALLLLEPWDGHDPAQRSHWWQNSFTPNVFGRS